MNFIGPEPTYSLISLNGSVLAMRSGMMSAIGALFLPSANSILVNGLLSRKRNVRSSTASSASSRPLITWPMVSRTIQRLRLAMTSRVSDRLAVVEFQAGAELERPGLEVGRDLVPLAHLRLSARASS